MMAFRQTISSPCAMRRARDATLAPPLLVLPNLQVNIAAAELPPADAKGHRFLRLPLQGV
jgi:hypothetical protein